MKRAIFIDKDGTLIPDIPFNVNPELISIEKDSIEGLQKLKKLGFLLVIVSNQPGVGYGYFKKEALRDVEVKIKNLLSFEGIYLDAFYYCPHRIEDDCTCRKPKEGMLLKAAKDLKIDLSASWMIGDILNDVEAGNKAGCSTILIDNSNETEWIINNYRKPNFRTKTINEAAEIIIQEVNYPQIDVVEHG